MKGHFELYLGWDGDWYWRFRADNGKVIYRASEGYNNKQDAIDTIPSLQSQPKRWIEV